MLKLETRVRLRDGTIVGDFRTSRGKHRLRVLIATTRSLERRYPDAREWSAEIIDDEGHPRRLTTQVIE